MVKLVSSSGNPFSYLPNAQIWRWPELLPSACRPRSPALEEYSAQSLKSPQAIPSSSASYGHQCTSVLSVCLDHSLCVQSFNLFNDSLELSSSEAFRKAGPSTLWAARRVAFENR